MTGLKIKKKGPFEKTFTIELTNGSYGYLPTPEQYEVGGYETWLTSNKIEKIITRKMLTELMSLFYHIDNKSN